MSRKDPHWQFGCVGCTIVSPFVHARVYAFASLCHGAMVQGAFLALIKFIQAAKEASGGGDGGEHDLATYAGAFCALSEPCTHSWRYSLAP